MVDQTIIQFVIDKMKKTIGDDKIETERFILKALNKLGVDFVLCRISEANEGIKKNILKKPANWLSKTLKFDILEKEKNNNKSEYKQKMITHFANDKISLFSDFEKIDIPKNEKATTKNLYSHYSPKYVPWPTILGPEFFTLSSNKNKSDEVLLTLRTLEGENIDIKMFRGRMEPHTEKLGILNVRHGKLFALLKQEWVKNGCEHLHYKNDAVMCLLVIRARKIVEGLELGYSGANLRTVTNLLTDLKNFPYYLEFESINKKGISLNLIASLEVVNTKTQGGYEKWYRIIFSPFISSQLIIKKRAVEKSDNIIKIKGDELSWLIRLYIEPRVLSLKNREFHKTLKSLIKDLCLPKANWHQYKAQRKSIISKAIKEIDNQNIGHGKILRVFVRKGKEDYLLIAYLQSNKEIDYNDKINEKEIEEMKSKIKKISEKLDMKKNI